MTREFQAGDHARNIEPTSVYYKRIVGKVGTIVDLLSDGYTFPCGPACNVRYPGVTDLYGREYIIQACCDLEVVECDTSGENGQGM